VLLINHFGIFGFLTALLYEVHATYFRNTTERKVTDQRTRAGIKVDLDNVGNEFGGEVLLFGTVGLHEQRQCLGDTNGMGELDAGTFAESSLTRKRPKGKPNVKPLRRLHNLMA
jgi:hypothetical protein